MSVEKSDSRLSRIKTRWTIVAQANEGQGDEAAAAQQRLILCYYRAVYHYLRAIVRDADVAEELTHEFSVRFLRGDFRRADPQRGRFRDLVKTAARNLALDYWKHQSVRKKKGPIPLPANTDPASEPEITAGKGKRPEPSPAMLPTEPVIPPQSEVRFLRDWRQAVLDQAWKSLARLQKKTGSLYSTMLRYKSTHPKARSLEIAKRMTQLLGRPITSGAVRQTLCRAREKFADYIVDAVARSLPAVGPAEIERELGDLNLLRYCKDAVGRFRKRKSAPPRGK